MANDSVSVFISYSHADEQYRRELGIALASLRDEGKVSEWHDRKIQGGEEWDEAIKRQLNKADIILLLLSADFIASDYIRKTEIPAAIERHQSGDAIVIPVFLRRFDYSPNAPYAKLQSYPPTPCRWICGPTRTKRTSRLREAFAGWWSVSWRSARRRA